MVKTVKKAQKTAQPKTHKVVASVKTPKLAAVKTPKSLVAQASSPSEFKWPKGEREDLKSQMNNLEVRGVPIQVAMKQAQAKQGDMYSVPVDSLQILDDFNVRIQDAAYHDRIRVIADSIKEHGFYRDRPLTVMCIEQGGKNVVFVVDGHTRLLAARMAISEGKKLDSLPVVAKPMQSTQEELFKALYTSNQGTPLKQLEFGNLLKRVQAATDQSLAEMAKMFTVTEVYARQCLAVARLPVVMRQMLNDNAISASTALEVSRVFREPKDQVKAAQEAMLAAEARGSQVATVQDFPSILAKKKPGRQFTAAIDFLVNKQAIHGDNVPFDVVCELLSVSFGKPIEEILKQCKASAQVDAATKTVAIRALTGTDKKTTRQLPLEGVAA